LTLNGKTLICKLCGIASPVCFSAERLGESGLTRLQVRIEGKDRIRMAVACYPADCEEDDRYEITPMSKWAELSLRRKKIGKGKILREKEEKMTRMTCKKTQNSAMQP
jgi:hypothetical protein